MTQCKVPKSLYCWCVIKRGDQRDKNEDSVFFRQTSFRRKGSSFLFFNFNGHKCSETKFPLYLSCGLKSNEEFFQNANRPQWVSAPHISAQYPCLDPCSSGLISLYGTAVVIIWSKDMNCFKERSFLASLFGPAGLQGWGWGSRKLRLSVEICAQPSYLNQSVSQLLFYLLLQDRGSVPTKSNAV